jgi:cytochrome P450
MSFSIQEAMIVLASLLRAVRLEMVETHPIRPLHRVTLRPEGGMPMRLRKRG